jgi:hypothetical protein
VNRSVGHSPASHQQQLLAKLLLVRDEAVDLTTTHRKCIATPAGWPIIKIKKILQKSDLYTFSHPTH